MRKELKPNKIAFLVPRIFRKIMAMLILILVLFIFLKFIAPDLSVGIYLFIFFIIISLMIYALDLIVYKKEFYIIYDDKIIQKNGSLFTNKETELNIKNITHLKLRLPFLEYKLFKTGHMDIQSAGSSASEIHLHSMVDYEKIHSLVINIMKKNGFTMNKGKLITTEKPRGLGVFFEVFKNFFTSLGVLFYLVYSFLYDEDGNKNEIIYSKIMEHIYPIVGIVILILFIVYIFKFLDLKKRIYEIYQNAIIYKEGFLSKNYSLLPFENLTDSSVTQTIIDKFFHLYDVKLSVQGSGKEILFKNMNNGRAMSDQLDILIDKKKSDNNLNKKQKVAQEKIFSQKAVQGGVIDENIKYDYSYTKQFKIDYFRTVKFPLIIFLLATIVSFIFAFILFVSDFSVSGFPLSGPSIFISVLLIATISLLILIFLASLISSITGYIKYRYTKFNVDRKSIRYEYNFLSSESVSFSSDKITGVMISRSFIDEWFKTLTVDFWSIGSGKNLVFSNIKQEEGLVESLILKFGMKKEGEIFNINPEFSLSEYIKSILPAFSFIVFLILIGTFYLLFVNILLSIGLVIITSFLFSLYYLYKKEYYKRTKLIFYKNSIYYQKGWFFKKFYYAKYKDIKDITTIRYPFSSQGKIIFDVASEVLVESNKTAKALDMNLSSAPSAISNNFAISYVLGIKEKDELIDFIFYKRPIRSVISKIKTNVIYKKIIQPRITVKPSLKNVSIFYLPILIFVDLVFLLVLFLTTEDSQMSSIIITIVIAVVSNILLLLLIYLPTIMTTYSMDGYRVLSKRGVIYKKQTSVIYDKIDFISNSQGLSNKLFKNGNITVNTVGSSNAELSIYNIPNYLEFYEQLKGEYEDN